MLIFNFLRFSYLFILSFHKFAQIIKEERFELIATSFTESIQYQQKC